MLAKIGNENSPSGLRPEWILSSPDLPVMVCSARGLGIHLPTIVTVYNKIPWKRPGTEEKRQQKGKGIC